MFSVGSEGTIVLTWTKTAMTGKASRLNTREQLARRHRLLAPEILLQSHIVPSQSQYTPVNTVGIGFAVCGWNYQS